jgi:hypothetical protein
VTMSDELRQALNQFLVMRKDLALCPWNPAVWSQDGSDGTSSQQTVVFHRWCQKWDVVIATVGTAWCPGWWRWSRVRDGAPTASIDRSPLEGLCTTTTAHPLIQIE